MLAALAFRRRDLFCFVCLKNIWIQNPAEVRSMGRKYSLKMHIVYSNSVKSPFRYFNASWCLSTWERGKSVKDWNILGRNTVQLTLWMNVRACHWSLSANLRLSVNLARSHLENNDKTAFKREGGKAALKINVDFASNYTALMWNHWNLKYIKEKVFSVRT